MEVLESSGALLIGGVRYPTEEEIAAINRVIDARFPTATKQQRMEVFHRLVIRSDPVDFPSTWIWPLWKIRDDLSYPK